MKVRKMVIDVLKPHEPSILIYSKEISALNSVDGVTIHVSEVDDKTESVEATLLGKSIDFDSVREVIEKLGGSVHSIDLVSAGSQIVEPAGYD